MYRIIFSMYGREFIGNPVDEKTVLRTVAAYLENGFPEVFKIEKVPFQ